MYISGQMPEYKQWLTTKMAASAKASLLHAHKNIEKRY